MPFFNFDNIKISAISSAVPTMVVKSTDFNDIFGEDFVKKFISSTCIKEYRVTHKYQTAADLGYAAAEDILRRHNIAREEIGAIVFASCSNDYREPATACVLHKRLGLNKECAAYDLNLGCSAFVYAITVVASMLQCSDIDKALLIAGDTPSKLTSKVDKAVAMLFGDSGSAVLLEKVQQQTKINAILRSDGEGYRAIIAPAGGYRNLNATTENVQTADGNIRNLYNICMKGTDVFSFSITEEPLAIKDFLQKTNTKAEDYDCFAMHQANMFIIKHIAAKLKIPMEKVPICLDRYGNTSAGSIPLVLSDAYGLMNDDLKMQTLMCGFGVGLSWGVLAAELNIKDIYPVIETDEYFEEGFISSLDEL